MLSSVLFGLAMFRIGRFLQFGEASGASELDPYLGDALHHTRSHCGRVPLPETKQMDRILLVDRLTFGTGWFPGSGERIGKCNHYTAQSA